MDKKIIIVKENRINESKINGSNFVGLQTDNVSSLLSSSDILPIYKSHEPIRSKEQIKKLVEEPLVSACEILFDKNIPTYMSSANGSNIYLQLNYDSLLSENKKIVKKLGGKIYTSGHSGFRPIVTFNLPPIEASIDYIKRWSERIANELQEQKMRVVKPTYSVDEFRDIILGEDINVDVVDKFFNENDFKYITLRGLYRYDLKNKRFIFKRNI